LPPTVFDDPLPGCVGELVDPELVEPLELELLELELLLPELVDVDPPLEKPGGTENGSRPVNTGGGCTTGGVVVGVSVDPVGSARSTGVLG
jgi:hypothetical protein